MVFRLPTPFESLALMPSEQIAQSRPWRGTFSLQGVTLFHSQGGEQHIHVTAAETEGDNRADLWPRHFSVQVVRPACRISDIQTWIKGHTPPLCMFMPDRLANNAEHRANDSNFRTLSMSLTDNQMIAVATWNESDRLPGAGIIIFPTTSSTGLLIGAVFLNSSFPEFIIPSRPGTSTGAGGSGGSGPRYHYSSEPSPSSYSPASNQPITPPHQSSHQRQYQTQQMGTMAFPGQNNLKMAPGVVANTGALNPAIARPFSPALSQLGRHAQASVRGHSHYPSHTHSQAHANSHAIHQASSSATWPVINEDDLAENVEGYQHQRW